MKNILLFGALIIFSPLFMGSSCNKKATGGSKSSCDGVACTMMFAMITAEVNDAAGQPVKLDEAYTIRKKNNDKILPNQTMGEGKYVILDDSYLKNIANSTESFRFVGFKDKVQVVDELYTISADCCHVHKEEGKNTIVLK